jgi:hypothetical protein
MMRTVVNCEVGLASPQRSRKGREGIFMRNKYIQLFWYPPLAFAH